MVFEHHITIIIYILFNRKRTASQRTIHNSISTHINHFISIAYASHQRLYTLTNGVESKTKLILDAGTNSKLYSTFHFSIPCVSLREAMVLVRVLFLINFEAIVIVQFKIDSNTIPL